jgi:putative endonuclease
MSEPTQKQVTGRLGEDIAGKYLKNKGFVVIGLNYRKKYGEIDIIAQKGKKTHFVEVKTFTRENFDQNVSRVTDNYRPEDNIHPQKLKRLSRTIQAYLLEKFPKGEPDWQFDAITLRLDLKTRRARVQFFENIIL